MTRFEQQTHPVVYLGIILSLALVFIADWLTPIGIAVWIFYVAPIGLCLLTARPNLPLVIASASSFGLALGYLVSPSSAFVLNVVQINRGFGFVLVWGVAVMARQILHSDLAIRKQTWLRGGQTGLGEHVQGDPGIEQLGSRVLDFLARYLDAHVGALYVRDDDGRFRCVAGFATDAALPIRVFALGQGLVGQAASSGRPLHVRDVPDDYLRISSGLGARKPRELLVTPATVEGTVTGVLELGFFHATHPSDIELLELLTERIAIAIRASRDRTQLERLLEETQRQAEALQTQQEELRVNNEELEEQGTALRESQTRLELQQTELEQTNSQLEEQAELLSQQKSDLEASQVVLSERSAELERASRYKSEFLANMSHELRTPLNSSLILAKLLADNRDGNLTTEQVTFAQNIYSAGNDLLDLINDILDLAKIESGKMEVKPETVRLSRLVQTLSQTFQPMAQQKGVRFLTSVETSAPESLETDPLRLQQILKNLLSNAVKFTERGDVGLAISRAPDQRIRFDVRDTGIGVPADQQQVIFEAFRQADGTTIRKYGGTGLGLSISRDLAGLLGGEITVASEAGKGSVFTLLLPAVYEPSESVQSSLSAPGPPWTSVTPVVATPPVPARRRPPPTSMVDDDRAHLVDGSRVLLIIEDDEAFARVISDLAHELDFLSLVAANANDGFELAVQYRPTAIVLDMNLPDHSGLTVLDRLKRNPATRHIPVQIASVEDHAQVALEMGAAGYLIKPVKREQLADAIARLRERFTGGVRSVLVVEDDRIQRESICHLLEAHDVRTVSVESAAAALEQLRTSTHDCMVLDISLPDASGFELLESMAEGDQYSFPPVIVYTGRSLSADEEQRLRKYSRSIIIKGARSPERLLDEVTLFLHQVEANLPADRRKMLQEARRRDAVFEGRTILVVEDDVRNIFALSNVLEPRGATLTIARNGREALAALSATPDIDMVLMDIMMPEMDGYEAMAQIRKHPEWRTLPIIALTAKAMRDDHDRALAAGASDYIAKPIDIEQLLSLMRVWMPRQAGSDARV